MDARGFPSLFNHGEYGTEENLVHVYGEDYDLEPENYEMFDWLNEVRLDHIKPEDKNKSS